jgi:hypothetical protein
VECKAGAGFSHSTHRVVVVKGARGLRAVASGEALDCEKVIYDSRPGAFIVTCFDSSSTSIITADYSGLRVYRGLYKRKPSSVHVGFNSYSIVFEDYRSIIIYGDNPVEIGIPILATAYTGSNFYGVSGKWLVRVGGDSSYEPLVLLGGNYEFAGVSNGLPVFKGDGRLYRLEGGALVELDFVKAPVERASVYDIVVVDNGRLLWAYDPSEKIFLELPKEPEVNCYVTRYGVLCCRSGLCGLVEPGLHEVKIGGFKPRYVTTPYPDIVPIAGIRAVIGSNVELVFRSEVAGRVAVVSQSSVKWYQVRPGLNNILAPSFSDTYHLVFDIGYSKYVYRVEIPLATQLRVAEAQANEPTQRAKNTGIKALRLHKVLTAF